MNEEQARYDLAITPTARRQLTENLPAPVATAAFEFIVGPLLTNPHRVGRQLRRWMTASARRGTYRVIYRIDNTRTVTLVDVVHRRDAYRPRG